MINDLKTLDDTQINELPSWMLKELEKETNEPLMLSTIDNPINPFLDFDKWLSYDTFFGHNCCSLVARFYYGDDESSELDKRIYNNIAVLEVVKNDPTQIYVAVTKDTDVKELNAKFNSMIDEFKETQ